MKTKHKVCRFVLRNLRDRRETASELRERKKLVGKGVEDLGWPSMSATLQRDQAFALAKRDPQKALQKAIDIPDPWFRAQALSCVARFTDDDPIKVARQAAKAASECTDDYKKTAVRAWEIAALAERKLIAEARKALRMALIQSRSVIPFSSRAEALMLLLQASFRIGHEDAKGVADELRNSCGNDSHWRCKRAVRDAGQLVEGKMEPRPFFH